MNLLSIAYGNKVSSWKWGILVIIGLLSGSSFLINHPVSDNEKIDRIFGQQLENAITELSDFEKAVDNKSHRRTLKKKFKEARLAYKKAAVLMDYFHPAETKLLNGPALPRTEEDNPITVYAPHGFQVIEELIFDDLSDSNYQSLKTEIAGVQLIYQQFQTQPNRSFPFKNPVILNALQLATIRMMALGISGFDSPVAQYSIPEASATLSSIRQLFSVYNPSVEAENKFAEAIAYLNTHTNFNRFDRIEFIRDHVQPIYSTLIKFSSEAGFEMPVESRPINEKTDTLFSPTFFNISFYSPSRRYQATPERIALGKKLFFDPILSLSKNRSCATCHKPELAFTDGLKTALALDQKTYLKRNTPTLWNSVYQTRQFFDSRVGLLEHQLNAVVHNQQEMGGSLAQSVKDLTGNKMYMQQFTTAYSLEEDKISQHTIANAISAYIRSLVSMNSRFDQYMRGDDTKMNADEKKGFNLFMGKAKCATCHFLPVFNGLVPPDYSETESEVLGVPEAAVKTNSRLDSDEGKFIHSRSLLHKFAFKTPTLRNIELTAPYMHNGVYNTLEEVMDFYNKGGGSGLKIAPDNQTLPEKKLNLSKKEIRAVIAFMKTLTDSAVVKYR